MIRTLLSTTALVALLATGAVAQDAAAPAPGTDSQLLTKGYSIVDTDGLASKLLGFPVYSSAANDAERVGEINDLVINEDGSVGAVIIGVGGFLGIGEKNVAVEYDLLQWTTAEDNSERIVLETTKEALNAAVAVELVDDEPADTAAAQPDPNAVQPADDAADVAAAPAPAPAADADVDETETGAVTTDPNMAADPNAPTMMDPLDRQNLVDFDATTLTAEELTGVNVYGPTDEHIGVIGDFVLGEDGTAIDAIIVDFGGFLGIGTKEVAVGFDNLQFYTDPNNTSRVLVLNVTREQMEQAPAFNRDTYAAERDTQRLVLEPVAAS
jgi:sporulation protein YlmC with PRC-barrel domain